SADEGVGFVGDLRQPPSEAPASMSMNKTSRGGTYVHIQCAPLHATWGSASQNGDPGRADADLLASGAALDEQCGVVHPGFTPLLARAIDPDIEERKVDPEHAKK